MSGSWTCKLSTSRIGMHFFVDIENRDAFFFQSKPSLKLVSEQQVHVQSDSNTQKLQENATCPQNTPIRGLCCNYNGSQFDRCEHVLFHFCRNRGPRQIRSTIWNNGLRWRRVSLTEAFQKRAGMHEGWNCERVWFYNFFASLCLRWCGSGMVMLHFK